MRNDEDELKRQKYMSDLKRLRQIRENEKARARVSPDIYNIDDKLVGEAQASGDLDISIVGSDYRYNKRKSSLELYPLDYNSRSEIRAAKREHTPSIATKKRAANKSKNKITNRDKILKRKSERKIKAEKEKNMKRPIPPRQGRAEPKGRKKKKGFFATIFLLLLLGFFAYFAFNFFTKQSGYYTVAIFGVDSRNGNLAKGALADVNIICNINRETNEIQLISVYRDTYSQIDDEGKYHKLNEAYFLGGHKQGVATLERMLDIKIDDYVTFNWKAVAEAINILGGVEVEITEAEFAYINSFITETVESTGVPSVHLTSSGLHNLDGVQAVAYARLRLMDTDFNRTQRQRKIASLAFNKAKQADFNKLKDLLLKIYPQVSSSMSVDDFIPFVQDVNKFELTDTTGFPFDKDTTRISKLSYVIPLTLESNVIALHKLLYNTDNYKPSQRLISISDTIVEKTGMGIKSGSTTDIQLDENNSNSNAVNPDAKVNQTKVAEPVETSADVDKSSEAIEETESSVIEESTTVSETEESSSADIEIIEPSITSTEESSEEIGPGISTEDITEAPSLEESSEIGPGV